MCSATARACSRSTARSAAGWRPGARAARGRARRCFDLQPRAEESDYELAFQTVEGAKRSLMMIFCDLLDESAAKPLADAVPVLTRRHSVTVATVRDPDLDAIIATEPTSAHARRRARPSRSTCSPPAPASRTCSAHAGAQVVEAPADQLAAACVTAYLRAKARGRA